MKFYAMAILAAVTLVFGLARCGDTDGGPTGKVPLTAIYTGYAGPNYIKLVITENTARYVVQAGDGYVLTVNLWDSKGTVSNVDGDELTLKPSNSETTFTVVVSGTFLAELNGTITYENSATESGPGALSEVNPAPTITTTTLPNGTVGTTYSQTLTATSITTPNWTIDTGSLPANLTLSTNGVISGVPTTAGTFNFTVKVTNAVYFDTKLLSIVINSSGGGQIGTNIAVKYRGEYDGWLDYDVSGMGNIETYGFFTLTEDKIIFVEDKTGAVSAEIFNNVSTGPDNVITYFIRIGTWAYLYEGTNKIGIVFHDEQDPRFEFYTGAGAIQFAETYLQFLGQTCDFSDMSAAVRSIQADQ